MKNKKIVWAVILTVCISLLISMPLYYENLIQKYSHTTQSSGLYELPENISPFFYDYYLCGNWEYYPDKLLFSDNIPGHFETMNPAIYHDWTEFQNNSPKDIDFAYSKFFDHKGLSSTEINTKAEHIRIPSGIVPANKHESFQCATYRLILKNGPSHIKGNLILSFSGLMKGNYKVFADGQECLALNTPFSYPAFFINLKSTSELVIEVTNTSSILNICPRLSYKGIGMTFFNNYKNLFIITASVLLTTSLLLLILLYKTNPKIYRLHFLSGICFSLYYFLNNCWTSGYLDYITKIIPIHSIKYVCVGFVTTGLILLGIIDKKTKTRKSLLSIGIVLLITGIVSSFIYNNYGIPSAYQFLMPSTLIIYIFFLFIDSKRYQSFMLKQTKDLLTLEKQTTKMQTAMLSCQIQPHFLYNTLSGIQEMCYTDPEEAANLIVRFSKYLRTNIDFMDYNELIPFKKEIHHIENYLYIQNFRFGNTLNFEKHLAVVDFMVPPLSIQPLIENAIKYGIRMNANGGTICLETYKKNHQIHITISNSGPGFDASYIKQNHSIENTKTRFHILMHGILEIHSQKGQDGTLIHISFPIDQKL